MKIKDLKYINNTIIVVEDLCLMDFHVDPLEGYLGFFILQGAGKELSFTMGNGDSKIMIGNDIKFEFLRYNISVTDDAIKETSEYLYNYYKEWDY